MSNMFKKVRIVHSPKERKYTVQEKRILAFSWTYVCDYDYTEVRSSNPHSTHDFATEAFMKARDKAETLLAKSVVWEGANFTWGS